MGGKMRVSVSGLWLRMTKKSADDWKRHAAGCGN
jgi:hypothetical protein